MPFVLGAKGSKWAWRNGRWDSVAHFKRVQRLWAIWGAVIWVGLFLWFAVLFGGVFYSLKNSEAYAMAASRLQASAEAADALGTPISTGFPWGSVSVGGGSGNAILTFSATGPKGGRPSVCECDQTRWRLVDQESQAQGGGPRRPDRSPERKEREAGRLAPARIPFSGNQ
jgi:hypothetical protein